MRVLVFGAGVIGRIYAARLMAVGHSVQVIARGESAQQLRQHGICLHPSGQQDRAATAAVFPTIVEGVHEAEPADVAFVAIRRDHLEAALLPIAAIQADIVVSLINLPTGLATLTEAVGVRRFVPAFPGVAGKIGQGGVVDYLELAQQPTTIGSTRSASEDKAEAVSTLLQSAGFRTTLTDDMPAWLRTHAVFIAAFESALAARSGDAEALASDSQAVRELVLAVREAFAVLARHGTRITPTSLRIIFQRMPLWFAARYWGRQLGGYLGKLGLAPHAMATRFSELPRLQQDVREILGAGSAPRLESLFASTTAP